MYATFAPVPKERDITSRLNIGRLVRHLEKHHKNGGSVSSARFMLGTGTWEPARGVLITDRTTIWHVPMLPEIEHYCPFGQGQRDDLVTFYTKSFTPTHGGPDMPLVWQNESAKPIMRSMILSHELMEIPGMRNKPGKLLRQFWFPLDDDPLPTTSWRAVFLDKQYTDILSPDLDELAGFRFETSGEYAPVRVSSVMGHLAYIMPHVMPDDRQIGPIPQMQTAARTWNGVPVTGQIRPSLTNV